MTAMSEISSIQKNEVTIFLQLSSATYSVKFNLDVARNYVKQESPPA